MRARRSIWIIAALVAPLVALVPAGASPSPARVYAQSWLSVVPVPAGLAAARSFPVALPGVAGIGDVPGLVDAHADYWAPGSADLTEWFSGHPLRSAGPLSTATVGDATRTFTELNGYFSCNSRHVAWCQVYYEFTTVGARQEVRVGVQAVWRPIVVVHMPSTGVATLTGYGVTSLMNRSSHPATATLTGPQRGAIARAIARLKDADGGICMEDSELFVLTVRSSPHGSVVWRARADECPGVLSITWPHHRAGLDARSCALDRAVAAALAPGATATRRALASCL